MFVDFVRPQLRDPLAAEVSSELLRRVLHRRGWTVRRLKSVPGLPEDQVAAWCRKSNPKTIPPPHFYVLDKALRLLDFEMETLLMCSLCEYAPYWTDDGRDIQEAKSHTLRELASVWGLSISRVQQIGERAIKKIAIRVGD